MPLGINNADFSDSYSLIYGHHMDNGTMFGDVALFLDEEFLAAHPAGVLITGEGTRNIRFFACVRTSEDDRVVYSLTSGASELAARADILPGAHFPPAPGQDAQIIADAALVTAPNCGHLLYGAVTQINFGDDFIYEEIAKPYAARRIPMMQLLRDEALAAFRAWDEKPDKVEY